MESQKSSKGSLHQRKAPGRPLSTNNSKFGDGQCFNQYMDDLVQVFVHPEVKKVIKKAPVVFHRRGDTCSPGEKKQPEHSKDLSNSFGLLEPKVVKLKLEPQSLSSLNVT